MIDNTAFGKTTPIMIERLIDHLDPFDKRQQMSIRIPDGTAENAIIGVSTTGQIIYSYSKLIKCLFDSKIFQSLDIVTTYVEDELIPYIETLDQTRRPIIIMDTSNYPDFNSYFTKNSIPVGPYTDEITKIYNERLYLREPTDENLQSVAKILATHGIEFNIEVNEKRKMFMVKSTDMNQLRYMDFGSVQVDFITC